MRIGAALELEDADGVAASQHLVGRRVVERHLVDVRTLARGRLDEVQGALDDRQVAQAQEVHLEQAEVLDAVHFVLGDDRGVLGTAARLGLALDRQVIGERIAGDHHRRGVNAVLAPQSLQAPGDLDHLGRVGIGRAHLP